MSRSTLMAAGNEEAIRPGSNIWQFTIMLSNRVGALCEVVNLLSDANVEVVGLSVQDSTDATMVRMVVSDPECAEALFAGNEVAYTRTEILVVELPLGASSLGPCLSSILMAEVNIHFSYPLLTRPSGHALLAFALDEDDFARTVLNKNGYKVLYQEDLSR